MMVRTRIAALAGSLGLTVALGVGALLLGVAAAAPGVSEFCTDNSNFGLSHGQCVSIGENLFNNGNADVVGLCKVFELEAKEAGGTGFPLGQCVSYFRHGGTI